MNKKLQILMIFLMIPVLSFSAEDEPSEAYIIGVINRYLKDEQKVLNFENLIVKTIFYEHTFIDLVADEEYQDNSIKREVELQNNILEDKLAQSRNLLESLRNRGYALWDEAGGWFAKFITLNGLTTWIPIPSYEQAVREKEAARIAARAREAARLEERRIIEIEAARLAEIEAARLAEIQAAHTAKLEAAERKRNAPRTASLNHFLGNELSPEESEWLSVEERIRRRDAYEAQKAAERNKGWFNWLWS